MKWIAPHLWVGDARDCAAAREHPGLTIIHACKTCHQRLLGYTGRGAPKESPEYLVARRGGNLYLNLIDAPTAAYIPRALILDALVTLASHRSMGIDTLVHCDEGRSRAPSLALLHLAIQEVVDLPAQTVEEAMAQFKEVYPNYLPKEGMIEVLRRHWPNNSQGEST